MAETLTKPDHPEHFDVHHESGEALMCMSSGGECRVLVEVMAGYSPEEEQQLIESTTSALQAIERFTDGRAANIFTGLHIKIGEDVAEGGAKADAEENQVLLNGRKMLLSVAEMKQVSGAYSDEELAGFPDEHRPGGALEYTLVHEIGHILDGQTKTGEAYHRVAASESPTKYGREADEWHSDNKDHEAFAEGFAHAVYGIPVSETMEAIVRETIDARVQEIAESQVHVDIESQIRLGTPRTLGEALQSLERKPDTRDRTTILVGNKEISDHAVTIVDASDQGFVRVSMQLSGEGSRRQIAFSEAATRLGITEGADSIQMLPSYGVARPSSERGLSDAQAAQYNGYTVRLGRGGALFNGLVQIDMPTSSEAPTDPVSAQEDIDKILSEFFGVEGGLNPLSPETEKSIKESFYRGHHKLGEEPLTAEQQSEIDSMTQAEVSDGHLEFVSPGKSREYEEKYGEYAVFHGTHELEDAVSMVRAGVLSILERSQRGVRGSFTSPGEDLETGVAKSVCTRTVTEAGVTGQNAEQDYRTSGFVFIFSPDVLDRTDWYAYPKDQYGAINGEGRQSPDEMFQQHNESGSPFDNEQIFDAGIRPELIAGIGCSDPKMRAELIGALRSAGMETVHGIPVESFVVAVEKTSDLIDVTHRRPPRSNTPQDIMIISQDIKEPVEQDPTQF